MSGVQLARFFLASAALLFTLSGCVTKYGYVYVKSQPLNASITYLPSGAYAGESPCSQLLRSQTFLGIGHPKPQWLLLMSELDGYKTQLKWIEVDRWSDSEVDAKLDSNTTHVLFQMVRCDH